MYIWFFNVYFIEMCTLFSKGTVDHVIVAALMRIPLYVLFLQCIFLLDVYIVDHLIFVYYQYVCNLFSRLNVLNIYI